MIGPFHFQLMIYAHIPSFFCENTLPLPTIVSMGVEILPPEAHLEDCFVDEVVPIAVLPPLEKGKPFAAPAEQEKEVLREEESSKSTDSNLEVLGEVSGEDPDPKGKGKKRLYPLLE